MNVYTSELGNFKMVAQPELKGQHFAFCILHVAPIFTFHLSPSWGMFVSIFDEDASSFVYQFTFYPHRLIYTHTEPFIDLSNTENQRLTQNVFIIGRIFFKDEQCKYNKSIKR